MLRAGWLWRLLHIGRGIGGFYKGAQFLYNLLEKVRLIHRLPVKADREQ
jgi:hypothetical protein